MSANWMKKIAQQRDMLKAQGSDILDPGNVVHVHVAHDGWCDLLNGKGECNCGPTVRISAFPPGVQ